MIGVSISPRIFDASSLGTFIAAWSNVDNPGPPEITICPSFQLPSLFPSKNHCPDGPVFKTCSDIAVKRFSLNKEAIAGLRSKHSRRDPIGVISRVRVVCAVIAKALIAVDRARHGRSRACLINQPVNMRGRTSNPPLPEHSCGNLVMPSSTGCISAAETDGIGIQELVDIMGEGIERTIAYFVRIPE